MSFFLPSFVQKRILRYALSRLELLDTDKLDLEKLDITWGRKSTIELRGIGLNIEKLAGLLCLPPGFSITKAQISTLRVTVPADLYQSGIVLEVDGAELTISAVEEAAGKQKYRSSGQGMNPPSNIIGSDGSKTSLPLVHDYEGASGTGKFGDYQDAHLPTTFDLAQSFVETEPKGERSELQAAVAKSLQQSQTLRLGGSDHDVSEVGIGNDILLPGFVAAYLKGVGDRVKIKIKNAIVDLILKVANPTELQPADDVKFRLAIDQILIKEVSEDDVGEQTRRVEVANIQLIIISEQSLFSSLPKSTVHSSPETAQASPVFTTGKKVPEGASFSAGASSPITIPTNMEYSIADLRKSHFSDFPTHLNPGLERIDDPASIITPIAEPEALIENILEDTALSDSFHSIAEYNNYYEGNSTGLDNLRYSPSFQDMTATVPRQLSAKGTVLQRSAESEEFISRRFFPPNSNEVQNNAATTRTTALAHLPKKSGPSMEDLGRIHESNAQPSPRSSFSSLEDLNESKIFSHDQRESMYMSVLSEPILNRANCTPRVPGAWDTSSIGSDASVAVQHKDLGTGASAKASIEAHMPSCSEPNSCTVFKGNQLNISQNLTTFSSRDEPLQDHAQFTDDLQARNESSTSERLPRSHPSSESPPGSPGVPIVLAKRVLSIDRILTQLPCGNSEKASFSQEKAFDHIESATTSTVASEYPLRPGLSNNRHPTINENEEDSQTPSTLVAVGDIQIVGDVGLTKLTILVAEKLNAICRPDLSSKTKLTPTRVPQRRSYVLTVEEFSWKFVELVKASSLPDESTRSKVPPDTGLYDVSDILLSSHISGLHLKYVQSQGGSRSKISLGKFVIGYSDSNILSFDAGLKMQDSIRDGSAILESDINLTIIETQGKLSVDLTTLPIHFILDLRRLDETFSWFGGFSSMLDLGSSMISTVTLLDPSAKVSHPKKAPRGVHFDAPTHELAQRHGTADQTTKITARVGGLVFDLQGSKSGLRVESTAMKLVSRYEGLGIQIDRLILAGRIMDRDDDLVPIQSKLANIRIEYLTTPKENDLTRLLTLLAPSKDTNDDGDDILVDTLLRQRKKGSVIRITVDSADLHLLDRMALQCFPTLMEEARKLSTVAKYLPEDDRPGVLTLLLIKSFGAEAHINDEVGFINSQSRNVEVANITFPSLTAIGVDKFHLYRNRTEELIGETVSTNARHATCRPMIRVRFVGNEMEPIVRIKIHNAGFEYQVATVMALMDMGADAAMEEVVSDMVDSIATLTHRKFAIATPSKLSGRDFMKSDSSLSGSKALKFDVAFREVILGLNPLDSVAKGLLVLTDAQFTGSKPSEADVYSTFEIRKADLMIIDSVSSLTAPKSANVQGNVDNTYNQVQTLSESGYVSVSQILAAKIILRVVQPKPESGPIVDIDIGDDLFVLESCADSTQTIINLLKGLKPPIPRSTVLKYQTEVVTLEDMFSSFSGGEFEMEGESRKADQNYEAFEEREEKDEGDLTEDDGSQDLEYVSSFHSAEPEASSTEYMGDSVIDGDGSSIFNDYKDKSLRENILDDPSTTGGPSSLDIRDDYFERDPSGGRVARRQNPKQGSFGSSEENLRRCPLRIRMRDVHVIWNLFDGYDWQRTRDTIGQAVADVQTQAVERQAARKNKSWDFEDDEEDVIGDFLFNSIYIGIPAKTDPAELARQVNHNIDDLVSETGSYTTSKSGKISPNRAQPTRMKSKQLKLQRSKHHKMTVELRGVSADLVVFPPGLGQTESSLDVRVQDFEIFDHVPTSTWKKFATYMHDAGEKEMGTSMVHVEILNVKPVPDLAASEIVLKVTVLPLRLHVDQDALDFMTRFFEFKDNNAPAVTLTHTDSPFIQRAEFSSTRVRLDFKPKRVDYAGLRSGRTTEFMNFFVLDSADMVLRHAIVYGVSGFDRLGKTLNDIWMPDIKRNQLPGVLAGLAPVRSLVNVGGGVRDLVVVPIREYRKDGRVVRSFQKGALAFAKTTTSELMRLGAKLAIGTQTVLQSTEDVLYQTKDSSARQDLKAGWDDSDTDEIGKKQISLYADQPVGVIQGLKGAYASLERDLLTAKDAVVAMPGEIMESGTTAGAAKAVLRGAPTVILRPAMGVSKAVGQTLMGATNTLNPGNRKRLEDKYKKY